MTSVSESLHLRWHDARDRISGRSDRLTPPRRLLLAGHSDFRLGGEEISHYVSEFAGLRSEHAVLDVGCAAGRIARPLTHLIGPDGRYEGFDPDREAIGWCRRRYRRYPNFHFQVADVFTPRTNLAGGHLPTDYRFPYADASFDLVLAISEFVHMLPQASEHFLAEIARVLKPEGRLLATFFLLNDVSRTLIDDGVAGLAFADHEQEVAILDEHVPEEAVAYSEEWLFEALRREGLTLSQVHPGSWSGRAWFLSFQDLIVAEREEFS